METFDTLIERMGQLYRQIKELQETKGGRGRNIKVFNLGMQAKSLRAQMDKYGCFRDKDRGCYEFRVQVKDLETNHIGVFRIVLTGITVSERVDPQRIIKHRLKQDYGDKVELHAVVWGKEVKMGTLLPA